MMAPTTGGLAAQRAYVSALHVRLRMFRANGAPFVIVPGAPTTCGACLSCGDPLPLDWIFGRCGACACALRIVAMQSDGVQLPFRQYQ
jgi:hypothetical protein